MKQEIFKGVSMITDAILNFTFGFFEKIFSLLPIPSTPDWVYTSIVFVNTWVGRGIQLFSWLFPREIYGEMIDILMALMLVRFSYDLYSKFHVLKRSS